MSLLDPSKCNVEYREGLTVWSCGLDANHQGEMHEGAKTLTRRWPDAQCSELPEKV